MPIARRNILIVASIFLLLLSGSLTAQRYELSSGTRPFQGLADGASIPIPITFGGLAVEVLGVRGETFNVMGREIAFDESTRLFIRGRGGISILDGPDVIGINALLSFYDTTDQNARISYIIEGEPGNRALTVEWRNGKFIDLDSGRYVTFQLKLYQSGIIEFHYGPNSIPESYLYPGFAFISHSIYSTAENEDIYMILGDPENPYLLRDTATTIDLYAIDRIPPEGTIYRLTPRTAASSVRSVSAETAHVGPNPATDRLIVRLNDASVGETELVLVSAGGKTLCSASVSGRESIIDVSEFPAGIYLLVVRQGGNLSTRKVVIR